MASLDRFFSSTNRFMEAVLRSPLHWPLSLGVMLITVTGRRSGRRRTFPVGYRREGESVVVMVSEASRKQWWRNLHDPAPVEMQLRGRACQGVGEVVPPDSPDFLAQVEATLRQVPGLARGLGIRFQRGQGVDPTQLEPLKRELAIVRIRLDDDGTGE